MLESRLSMSDLCVKSRVLFALCLSVWVNLLNWEKSGCESSWILKF